MLPYRYGRARVWARRAGYYGAHFALNDRTARVDNPWRIFNRQQAIAAAALY